MTLNGANWSEDIHCITMLTANIFFIEHKIKILF